MKKLLLLVVALFCLSFTGCNAKPQQTQIAATTLPVYELCSLLCEGTDIQVTHLITENISCLHDYTLQVKQIRMVEQADLLVISGAGLEHFLEDSFHLTKSILDASSGIELICNQGNHNSDHSDSTHQHDSDPHIWLSPVNGKKMAENIYQGLLNAYPQYESVFSQNMKNLEKEFDKLMLYGETQLDGLSTRNLVTFHDGFSYMADAFHLNILRAVEEESGSEASAAELIELINTVSCNKVPAIFTEINGSTAAASIIAAETGVAVYTLDMGIAGNSYFSAMYHNIDTLREALK